MTQYLETTTKCESRGHFAEEQNETQIALRFETKIRRDTSRLSFAFAKVMWKKSKTLLGRSEHRKVMRSVPLAA